MCLLKRHKIFYHTEPSLARSDVVRFFLTSRTSYPAGQPLSPQWASAVSSRSVFQGLGSEVMSRAEKRTSHPPAPF